jgi:hypothetical protein
MIPPQLKMTIRTGMMMMIKMMNIQLTIKKMMMKMRMRKMRMKKMTMMKMITTMMIQKTMMMMIHGCFINAKLLMAHSFVKIENLGYY